MITKKIETFLNKKYCILSMAGCIVISILVAIMEGVINIFKLDTSHTINNVLINIRVLFIYLAAGSLVGLLAELRTRLKKVELGTIRNFCNRLEAGPNIIDSIKNAALKNKNEPLVIKVYGWRLRQNIQSIKMAVDQINAMNKKTNRKIILYLYYSNTEFLENFKSFNDDASFTEMIDEQKKSIKDNIQRLKEDMRNSNYDFLEIKYRKHFDTPQFWLIQIGDNDIFWGYFTLSYKDGIKRFDGSFGNCFHFKNGNSEIDGFFDWVNNIFDRLEEWSKKA